MADETITLTLSKADAEVLVGVFCEKRNIDISELRKLPAWR